MAMTFIGGMKIPVNNRFVTNKPVKTVGGTRVHYFPLQQHKGAPLVPLVGLGEHVKVGQKLADNEDYTAVPVHTSVSGIVTDIFPRYDSAEVIAVENDFKDEIFEGTAPVLNTDSLTKREMLWVVRDAGIIGLGGSGFPTHMKLDCSSPIITVIINGAESELYASANRRRLVENAAEIIDGTELVMKMLDAKRAYIGITTEKKDALERLRVLLRYREDITAVPLKNRYPQGDEKLMVRALTGNSVPPGAKPQDVGAVVLNVETVYHIHRAFRAGMPLTERIVTVTGDCFGEAGNYLVKLGMPISELAAAAGGILMKPQLLLCGGTMGGRIITNMNEPVTKGTFMIFALSEYEAEESLPCIKCGRCRKVCPARIAPDKLERAVLKENEKEANKLGIEVCTGCGLCSYVCPSARKISAEIMAFADKTGSLA